ncbi:hypothetical protein AYO20_04466 [Fonsecaea nubica]|uniref:Xylanolytic transcriptional activator regulatory domain-containing protein n=1 Tax=Fonsecaea nubica TaxID=856822 RepID=A0A178D2F3_9EURO|nr:hypothetical protein AYO20_04466 [Fonsecaea nubica]OAL36308.1 hypothetical protein AYO20_04466 [Fonsecaea nubica]
MASMMDSAAPFEEWPQTEQSLAPRKLYPGAMRRRRADQRACDSCRYRKIKVSIPRPNLSLADAATRSLSYHVNIRDSVMSGIDVLAQAVSRLRLSARPAAMHPLPGARTRREDQIVRLTEKLAATEDRVKSLSEGQERTQACLSRFVDCSDDCRASQGSASFSGVGYASNMAGGLNPRRSNELAPSRHFSLAPPLSLSTSPPTQLHHSDGEPHNSQFFGPTSGVVFASAIKDFIQRQGGPGHVSSSPIFQTSLHSSDTRVPSSDWEMSKATPLLTLLPRRQQALQLLDIYRVHVQEYTPVLPWPSVLDKFARLYDRPVRSGCKSDFIKDFVLLNAVWSIGSQLTEESEAVQESDKNEVRSGWRFFSLARDHYDLAAPKYDLDDAAICLLMSIYLQGASLLNTCWVYVGLTARIIQDLGLHIRPTNQLVTPAQVEVRNRLFWGTYLVDRKIALTLGRTVALLDEECSVDLPRDVDPATFGGSDSTEILRVSVQTCSKLRDIINFTPSPNHQERDMTFLFEMDSALSQYWEDYPLRMKDFSQPDAYEPSCLKVLCILMQARLTTMRHFTDTSLNKDFRKWCFTRSVQIALVTLQTVNTLSRTNDWERKTALFCSGVVYGHIFRAALVLALAGSKFAEDLDTPAERHRFSTLWEFLRAASSRRTSVLKYLQLLEVLAKALGTPLGEDGLSRTTPAPASQVNSDQQSLLGGPRVGGPVGMPPTMHDLTNSNSRLQSRTEYSGQETGMPMGRSTRTLFPPNDLRTGYNPLPEMPEAPSSAEDSGLGTNSAPQTVDFDWELFDQIMDCDSSAFPTFPLGLDMDGFDM